MGLGSLYGCLKIGSSNETPPQGELISMTPPSLDSYRLDMYHFAGVRLTGRSVLFIKMVKPVLRY